MAVNDDDNLTGLRGDDRIVQEARSRFKACRDWQDQADRWSLEDEKFARADARNRWQWPAELAQVRDGDERPCLTINKVQVHNNIIINEAMRNRSSIKVRPTGGQASYQASQVMQSIVRRIEYISKASIAYNLAIKKQVDGGIGYVFIETAYVNERTFDQDIYLRPCRNPRNVYLDPDIREPDGSDARFGFIFEDVPRNEFRRKYRKYADKVGRSTLENDDYWLTRDHVKRATYYRKKDKPDLFVSFVDPATGQRIEKLGSEIREDSGPEIADLLLKQIEEGEVDGKTREVTNQQVEWFIIFGDCVVERGDWLGKYIPIARCVGSEDVIEGKLDRKGHTRSMIDAQRMLNYNASASVEFGALQTKTPYVGPARAFEGQEQWKDANRKNYAFLAYNDYDEDAPPEAQQIAAPKRIEPPQAAAVFQVGMQDAERHMMIASGQLQAQLGENDQQSAASGRAISERQRQADTATYHFVEHQGDMLRFIGMQLIDLIPKIYDTKRTLHILGEDGTKRWIQIDPNQKEAVQELKKETEEAAELSFNPRIGEYDCMSDPGPNYATQRQEAWNAISIILQQNMELAGTIGDLLFKFGDFPGADEIMERLKKEIQATKPYLFSEDQPALQAMQLQLQNLQKLNADLMQKLAEMQLKLKGKAELRDIQAYDAESKRITALSNAQPELSKLGESGMLEELIRVTVDKMLKESLAHILPSATEAGAMNGSGAA